MAGLLDLEFTNGKMDKLNGHHSNGVQELDVEQTKNEIFQLTCFSSRLEKVLLALLKENTSIRDEMANNKLMLLSSLDGVTDNLAKEKQERMECFNELKGDLEAVTCEFKSDLSNLNNEVQNSLEAIKIEQDADREKVAKSLSDVREEFEDNLDQVKNDIVTEIKDNISVLSDSISSLENAIHDDVNKLKNMMCDLGENMEEEKLLRLEEEKKLKEDLERTNDILKESENKLLERLYDGQ